MVAVASEPEGDLHAAWYETSQGSTSLLYARSDDLGTSWDEVRVVPGVVTEGRARLGDYLGLAASPGGGAFLAWTAVRSGSLRVFASHSSWLDLL